MKAKPPPKPSPEKKKKKRKRGGRKKPRTRKKPKKPPALRPGRNCSRRSSGLCRRSPDQVASPRPPAPSVD